MPCVPPVPSVPATQRKLILTGESRPLVLRTVSGARDDLPGHDEDNIKALWEDGHLLAWNIALGDTIDARIWPDSIAHYLRTLGSRPYPRTADQVLPELCKSSKPFLTTTELRIRLNCGATHIINLVDSKQLKLQPKTDYGRGAYGVALITTASLRQFLISRRLP